MECNRYCQAWRRIGQSCKTQMENLGIGGHPIVGATSALNRGQLESKGAGKLFIHFFADEATMVTIFRTIISVNQLNIYGAITVLCEEFGQTLIDSEKTYAVVEPSESMVAPTDLLNIQRPLPTNEQEQNDLVFNPKRKSAESFG